MSDLSGDNVPRPDGGGEDSPRGRRRAAFNDHVALWLLKLAKLRRRNLTVPAGDDYDKFYEQFFDDKDIEAYDRDRRMVVRRETINRFLAEHAPPPRRVLDVGCGLGDVLAEMPGGYDLIGMDYAAFNVKVASRRLRGKAAIAQGSIYEMPYETASMDVCLCLEVLEHIEEDARAVREIARVLKPGGMLLAAVPYTYYWPEYLQLMGHFRHYTRETFSRLMDENGLQTERYLPNYPNWHQTYTRRYAMTRAQAMTFGRLLGRSTLYTFRWPWRKESALNGLAASLEPLRDRDGGLDYAQLPTSTFLVARKGVARAD
ncbi:MAG: class I SAM-dependent methyltransferase [Tepidisphaeraceae bacterium]